MNILEIKNNLVKIAYNTEDNLALAEFVIIEDTNSPYVAQIMNLKSSAEGNFAIVKLLFTFDSEGVLKNYNGTIPSNEAKISKIPSSELLDIIPVENPLILGKLAQQETILKVDKSVLENNLLICSNNIANTEDLLVSITSQLNGEKAVIIDSEGQLRIDKKIVFGKDFKLPLNVDTIDYIYDNDLADVQAVNKAVIQDVLIEVQNYIKTLPEKFLPFDTFIGAIDNQYRETQIPELILLKNKLLKYKEMNVFAQDLKEILDLSITIDKSDVTVIDISDVTEDIQREVIRYIYSVMNESENKIYAFAKVNNSNITKRLLKRFVTKDNIFTTVICPHEFKYIEDIKAISQNIIFFAPLTLTHDFASYNTYLNKLNSNEFVVYGAHTQNIPLIVETIDEIIPEQPAETTQYNETVSASDDENVEIVETDDIKDVEPEENNVEEVVAEAQIESYPEENEEDTIVETTTDEADEENIVEPLDNTVEETSEEDMNERIAKDVDRAFYEKLPEDDADDLESTSNNQEDELTEDDLNLIDDLASDEVPLAGDTEAEDEEPVIEEEEEAPPIVPIYPADDIEEHEGNGFKPGDRVTTEKFGEGVVEKMIKYGNKMLCSIDFPEIGRRLLDPAITDIKLIK